MSYLKICMAAIAAVSLSASLAIAGDDPIHERHEMMEDVGKAAKPVGKMLKGEADYDPATLIASMQTMQAAAQSFGKLFPEGSETGGDTEAAPAIWEDRTRFENAIADWAAAVDTVISAQPASLEEARPLAGSVFKTCKGCHETYRIDKDD